MRTRTSQVKNLSFLAFLLVGLYACSSGGDTGRLSLSLTDASTDQYNAVYVTIGSIAVHAAGDAVGTWTTIAEPNRTINLLSLANGIREQLALVDLNPGQYTQMRLIIGETQDNGLNILDEAHPFANYVIDASNEYHQLKIPSGMQTGVKLVQGFEINENSTTELTLDFDASRSVVVAGHSGKYILKPTIHVIDTKLAAIVSGTVTKQADQTPLEGALISVQAYDAALADPKDQVSIRTSTLSAVTGAYKMFFAVADAGATFEIVATKDGYLPSSTEEFIENGKTYTDDFPLAVVGDVGTVEITVQGADADAGATLSFRQEVTPGGPMIEIKTINFLDGSFATDPTVYQVVLPVGSYTVVASTPGKTTLVLTPLAVAKTPNATLSVIFP